MSHSETISVANVILHQLDAVELQRNCINPDLAPAVFRVTDTHLHSSLVATWDANTNRGAMRKWAVPHNSYMMAVPRNYS